MFILPVGVSSSTGKTRSFDATLKKKRIIICVLFLFLFLFLFLCQFNRSIDQIIMSKKCPHKSSPSSLQQKKMCVKKKKVTKKKSHKNIFNQTNPPAYLLT